MLLSGLRTCVKSLRTASGHCLLPKSTSSSTQGSSSQTAYASEESRNGAAALVPTMAAPGSFVSSAIPYPVDEDLIAERVRGTVLFVDSSLGWGYIERGDLATTRAARRGSKFSSRNVVYFKRSSIAKPNPEHRYASLAHGELVEYDVIHGKLGMEAIRITSRKKGCVEGDEWMGIGAIGPGLAVENRRRQAAPVLAKDVQGSVHFYNPRRGFGFLKRADTGETVYFQAPSLSKYLHSRTLTRGDPVRFDVIRGRKESEAINITDAVQLSGDAHYEVKSESNSY